jgi:hypothetical protein
MMKADAVITPISPCVSLNLGGGVGMNEGAAITIAVLNTDDRALTPLNNVTAEYVRAAAFRLRV